MTHWNFGGYVRELYSTHVSNETQATAVDTILESLLDVEFVFSDGKTEEDIPEDERDVWRTAVVRITRQLLIYGYCLCRVVRVRADAKDEISEDIESRYRVEVACGTTIVPTWNRETVSWNFQGLTTGTKMDVSKGWITLIYTEPVLHEGQPLLRSGAARAFTLTKRLDEMEQNQIERDRLNSLAVVITQRANTGGHAPEIGRNPEMTLLYGQEQPDLASWSYDQKQLMVEMVELSKKEQENNRQLYESSSRSKKPRIETPNLMQLPVARGQTGTELSVRHGPPEFTAMIATLKNDIFWAFNVPPLIKAMKATSERTSSADRMMQVILTDWDRFIRHLRACVQRALTLLSKEMTETSTYVHMRARMSAFCLQQIRDVMHIKPLRTAMAAIYNVDERVIDTAQLRLVRELEQAGPENRKQNAHDVDGGGKGVASDAEKAQSHTLKHTK